MEEKIKTDEIIEEPDEAVEDNSIQCCGIPSGRSWQDVQSSAIKLLASRLIILRLCVISCLRGM